MRATFAIFLGFTAISFNAFASVTVQLTPSISSASVGTTVTWTATASDSSNSNASFTYQFSVGPSGSSLQVRRDFSSINQFPWTESDQEGSYNIQVVAQESSSTASATTAQTFVITSRVTGSTPVISATAHPLVALFSAPACPVGSTMQVQFRRSISTYEWITSPKTCNGTTSMNFYIGGMRPSTEYVLQSITTHGNSTVTGPTLTYTTGAIPSTITLEQYTMPTTEPTTSHPVVLTSPTAGVPFATDSVGSVIWYLPAYQNNGGYLTRPVPGGTFLGVADDNSGIPSNRRLMREYDMAGNLIRETNTAAISAQLVALGTDPITSIHHEAFRFPNGDTGLIGSVEKIANQGSGNVDVLGDMAIVVDSNLQVKWFWDEFDNLNILRPAILGETCQQGNAGCPHLYQPGYSVANDWTHSNAFAPTPDGNLIISIRHQDWIVKLNYQNGSAPSDGAALWRLGREGDFTVSSSDPCPWFSHEHDTTFAQNGLLTIFDNGNTRITEPSEFCGNGSSQSDSRGQSWQLDETHKVATAVLNLDLHAYSIATGSAELSPLGNYNFFLGFINGTNSKSMEYTPSGQLRLEEDFPQNVGYRGFRMATLYQEF